MKTLKEHVIAAGYAQRIDMVRLLADLREQPGCESVKARTMYNYLKGVSTPRGAVLLGLAAVLGVEPKRLI